MLAWLGALASATTLPVMSFTDEELIRLPPERILELIHSDRSVAEFNWMGLAEIAYARVALEEPMESSQRLAWARVARVAARRSRDTGRYDDYEASLRDMYVAASLILRNGAASVFLLEDANAILDAFLAHLPFDIAAAELLNNRFYADPRSVDRTAAPAAASEELPRPCRAD